MDNHDKIVRGLEKTVNQIGLQLNIEIAKDQAGNALIVFTAGRAQVYCRLSSFCRAPQIVLDPFCDELVKHYAR